ncbi:protein phosphatase Slingshot homolog 1-like [Paramacrobiotus metropolitanus]|uniref:protein phosphatase Slingshot homolog 1-like n=1 Tax=Paramacrobiotus metropolitanus TaxID=2943436 RepID=UPI002445750A|nr:protein phosphatase Slingshot homolog 1-like [Paramacrobiotus metropolitanus]
MSQISVHSDSSLATIHSSHPNVVSEVVKHLAAVLKLLRPQDQLKMVVRLESLLTWDDHIRYLAVISTKDPRLSVSLTDLTQLESFPEEFCILGIDVPITPTNPLLHTPSPALQPAAVSTSAPGSPQKAQRSHSTVSPDQHQGIGSRIASRTRKFLTLPKQKSQTKQHTQQPSPTSPRMAKRPSISSSVVIKLDDLKTDGEKEDVKICVGLALPITADMKITLDGDGGFRIDNRLYHHIFKPVSVQAMWSVLQTLLKASENAKRFVQSAHRLLHTCSSTISLSTTTTTTPGSSTTTLTQQETSSMVSLEQMTAAATHSWVDHYARKIDSQSLWVKEWHLIFDDIVSLTTEGHGGGGEKTRRPLSPHMSRHRQQVYTPTEMKIRQHLRDVMLTLDLEQVNSKEIRQRVESTLKMDLSAYKSFIDHEILVILGQMDSASEIFDHLYLGTEWNAGNLEELRKKGIELVLNVTTEINNFFPNLFHYQNIRVNDTEEEDMLQHWERAFRYIADAKKEGKKVLVHCKMGVSRSASVVIAYAMKANDWDLEKAMQFVKERRSCVQPNPGFMKQLEVYQGILEASKHRSSWQSVSTTGSTLSLNDTRSPNKFSASELDDLDLSNLRRTSSEFFSAPNLAPAVPQRSESLKLPSRPATFYLAGDTDSSSSKAAKAKREKRESKWEAIEENVSKEEPEDAFGMFRIVLEPSRGADSSQRSSDKPADRSGSFSYTKQRSENLEITRRVTSVQKLRKTTSDIPGAGLFDPGCTKHRGDILTERNFVGDGGKKPDGSKAASSGTRAITEHLRQAASSFASTTIPKAKSRQIFGSLQMEGSGSGVPPVKENKYYSAHRRPASIHVSSYLKPKDPVQTLVKYFDELNVGSPPHAANPAPQAAQV